MNDQWVIRAVVVGLVGFALLGQVGVLVLGAMGRPVPHEVVNMASTAIGAVAALLARTSTTPPPAKGGQE